MSVLSLCVLYISPVELGFQKVLRSLQSSLRTVIYKQVPMLLPRNFVTHFLCYISQLLADSPETIQSPAPKKGILFPYSTAVSPAPGAEATAKCNRGHAVNICRVSESARPSGALCAWRRNRTEGGVVYRNAADSKRKGSSVCSFLGKWKQPILSLAGIARFAQGLLFVALHLEIFRSTLTVFPKPFTEFLLLRFSVQKRET